MVILLICLVFESITVNHVRSQPLLYKRHPRTSFPSPTFERVKSTFSVDGTRVLTALLGMEVILEMILVTPGTCLIDIYSLAIVIFCKHEAILSRTLNLDQLFHLADVYVSNLFSTFRLTSHSTHTFL